MKKPITELTTEELLKFVENSPTGIPYLENSNDVLDFISAYGIKNGPNPVRRYVLFRVYRMTSAEPVKSSIFYNEMRQIIISKDEYYYINIDAFSLKKEIIDKLKKKSKTRIKSWGEHFNKFISKYQLKKGGLWIKDIVLYNIYDKWVYEIKKREPLNLVQFNRFCVMYFENKRAYNHYFFKLDKSIQSYLSEDLIKLNKEKKHNNEKTTHPKKLSKIPGIRSKS